MYNIIYRIYYITAVGKKVTEPPFIGTFVPNVIGNNIKGISPKNQFQRIAFRTIDDDKTSYTINNTFNSMSKIITVYEHEKH